MFFLHCYQEWRRTSGTVVSEIALSSAGNHLLRAQASLLMSWPGGGPKSLRSPCCGLAVHKPENRTGSTLAVTALALSCFRVRIVS
ncbi:hypothetical protein PoB_001603600 [Plakobranchus ocellatus]|uniref:Uncharacterized protein n=1 Tax=Plakobranchus ocellatus TaxID=259542 RepID=A0AAV3Z4J2_9GAST|nr:hypothetical protein PoB_001603600 [Plakobranchus ocellatus]